MTAVLVAAAKAQLEQEQAVVVVREARVEADSCVNHTAF